MLDLGRNNEESIESTGESLVGAGYLPGGVFTGGLWL